MYNEDVVNVLVQVAGLAEDERYKDDLYLVTLADCAQNALVDIATEEAMALAELGA
jgi:hypothetical protein